MSREIKFRYHWTDDGPECAFPYPVISIFGFGADMEIQVSTGEDPRDTAEYTLEGGVLCQYTGLKDKNGREIYEGDVVRCVNDHVGAIEWEEHDCCFNVDGYYSSGDDYPTMAFVEGQPFEVIGNIHENPEFIADHSQRQAPNSGTP